MSIKEDFKKATKKVKQRKQERKERRLAKLEDGLLGDVASMIRMIFGNPGSRSLR